MSAPATPEPEFSVPVSLASIGEVRRAVPVAADEAARAALARRFDLIALDQLAVDWTLWRDGAAYCAEGTLRASASQRCVISGEAVPALIEEPVVIAFIAEDADIAPDAEIELSAEDCDTMFHDGRVVDLGEAAAQSLALLLDPFPRAPDADARARAAGIKQEEEAGAFGALAALKAQMEKKA